MSLHRWVAAPLEEAAESRVRRRGVPMHRRVAAPLLEVARLWGPLPIRLHPLTSPKGLLPLALALLLPPPRLRSPPCLQVPRPRLC